MTLVSAPGTLAVGYGGRPVLEGLTFAVEPGERVGVLGPNGGGKSTLVRALLGELDAARGPARAGRALQRRAADRALAARLPGHGARRRR